MAASQRLGLNLQPVGENKRVSRFERLFTPEPNTGCWLWIGDRHPGGYGFCWTWGAREMAHRRSYVTYKGSIPEGMIVRHTCDVPLCVNPDHLVLGTQADNIQDKVQRNRQAKGEGHGNARLTEAEVKAIRRSSASSKSLGRNFGVSATTIRVIKTGRGWKHVEAA